MVESKIRVEVTHISDAVNKDYYGKTITKKVIEETFIHDMDKREDIAPYGVTAIFSIDKSYIDDEDKRINAKDIFDIKVNRRYFDYENENTYITFFHVDEKVYELCVKFDGKKITYITLSEWLNEGDFEDGEDADNIYGATNKVCGIQEGLVSCDILEA